MSGIFANKRGNAIDVSCDCGGAVRAAGTFRNKRGNIVTLSVCSVRDKTLKQSPAVSPAREHKMNAVTFSGLCGVAVRAAGIFENGHESVSGFYGTCKVSRHSQNNAAISGVCNTCQE